MNRRDFALAAALLPAFPLLAQQSARRYRIGTLTAAWAPNHPSVEGLRAGLAALGMIEGRDVVFEHRYTEGDLKALPGAAAALVASGVDLIFTSGENATRAAAQTTRGVPIVFANVGDPVASGVVRDLAHPGGNVTGVSSLATELASKRLQLLKELAPKLRRVWAIYNVEDAAESRVAVRRVREAASVVKVELLERPVRTTQELGAVLAEVLPGDGYFVYDRATSLDISNQIVQMALPARALTTFGSSFWVDWGALMAYGADYYDVGVQAARQAAKILMGTPPQDVPVEGANKIKMVINGKVAKALGLKIPQSILLRADRVIE
jgi:putative ABC transport system substrate-binding protein